MHYRPKALRIVALVLIFLSIFSIIVTCNIIFNKASDSDKKLMITAHRGDSANAPENTLPAIQKAIEDGADYVEIDVRQTKDNVLVLLHDNSLERTAGINKNIWEYNYSDLAGVDVGSWFGTEYSNTPIPTLEQALQITKGRIKVNIDIKDSKYNHNIVSQVTALITQYNMEEDCSISSSNYQYLQEVRSINQYLTTGIILNRVSNPNQYPDVDFYSINYCLITKELIYHIHGMGKEIYAWTVDGKADIYALYKMDVDNIITNDPLAVAASF